MKVFSIQKSKAQGGIPIEKRFSNETILKSGAKFVAADAGNNYTFNVLQFNDVKKFIKNAEEELGVGYWGFEQMDNRDIFDLFASFYPEIANAEYYVGINDWGDRAEIRVGQTICKSADDPNYKFLQYIGGSFTNKYDLKGISDEDKLSFYTNERTGVVRVSGSIVPDNTLGKEIRKRVRESKYRGNNFEVLTFTWELLNAKCLICLPSQKYGAFFTKKDFDTFCKGLSQFTSKFPTRRDAIRQAGKNVIAQMEFKDAPSINSEIWKINRDLEDLKRKKESLTENLGLIKQINSL